MTRKKNSNRVNNNEINDQVILPFGELADLMPDAAIILDTSMQIVYLNSNAVDLFGYSTFEAVGQKLDIFLPDEVSISHSAHAVRFLIEETNSRRMGENRLVHGKHRDGRIIPLDISITQRSWNNQLYVICVPRDISHQIAIQQSLNASEQRYRSMIDSQNTLVVRVDREGHFVFANQAYCQMFGKTLDELIGNSFTPLVHPDDLPITLEAMKGLEKPPYRITVDQRAMTDNGWRWIAWEDSLIQDADGNSYEILGVGYDITERKQAEEIAFSERDLAIILAQQSNLAGALPHCLDLILKVSGMDSGGIYLVDRQNKDLILKTHKGLSDVFVAQASRVLAGSDRHQLVLNSTPFYQPYLLTEFSKNKINLDEGLRSLAIIPMQANNEVIACINAASHSLDEMPESSRNALEHLSIHIGNMIARFYAQEELAESQNELESMFNSLQDYVFILDDRGHILQVNQKVLVNLGYQREELIGKNVLEVHPVDQRAAAWQIVSDMLSGVVDTCPLNLLKKDGLQIPVETKVARGRWGSREALIGVSRDITERKAAEELIREKIKEIEGFFNVSLELLCIADLDGNFLRVNNAWESILGFSVEEIQKRKFLDFVHPNDLQSTLNEMVLLGEGRQTLNFVNRYQHKDGSWRYIEWRAQMEGAKIYAAARDITDRKAAEDAQLQQTKLLVYRHNFEEILTGISTQFISLPTDQINIEITHALKQIGEFEQVDRCYVFLIDQNTGLMKNTHEWCAPGIEPQIDVLQDLPISLFPWWIGKLKKMEYVHIPIVSELPVAAQSEREILESQAIQSVLVVPLATHDNLVGFLGFDSVAYPRNWSQDSISLIKMVGDILLNALRREQMENELRQSEARNSALLSAVPDLILRIRRDGIFLDYKASANGLLAISPDQIVGSSIGNILDETHTKNAMRCIVNALENKQIQTMEYTIKNDNSSRVFEARFKDSGKDEVTAIIRDISERARLEQMKSDFINRASHELRTPIATMLLMANLIDGGTTQEEYREYWDVMKSELDRERLLVEDLLSVGRLENNQVDLHFSSFNIGEFIELIIHQVELPAREKSISILRKTDLDLDEATCLIDGDKKALTQVFLNIINNAIKFTPANGKITIILKKKDFGFETSIIDTGMGIPAEDIPLLFTRFFRGANAIEEEVPGTGIGLFIVRSILEKHGGKIKVWSELGKGSQFDIWLPGD